MARKIIVPEEELHNIADAINNRADYLDSMTEGTPNKDSLVEDPTTRKMATKDMADNIIKLSVNLTDYYTKEEIDELFVQNKVRLVFGDLPARGEEGTFYFINKFQTGNANVLDLRVYIWQNDQFTPVSSTTVDFSNYATKSQLNSKLLANSTATPNEIIFTRQGDSDNNAIITMTSSDGIILTQTTGGVLNISLDVDNLHVATPPEGDNSTAVATTEFVATAISNIIGGDGFVKYVIVEEGEEPQERAQDTLYVYPETNQFFLGDYEISGAIFWGDLPHEPLPIWLMYSSNNATQWNWDLSDITIDNDYYVPADLSPYEDIFGVQTWNNLPAVWWGVWLPDGQDALLIINPYPDATDYLVYDTVLDEYVNIDRTPSAICDYLGVTDYGTEENPSIYLVPEFDTTVNVPFYGYDINGGYWLKAITGFGGSTKYCIHPTPSTAYDETRNYYTGRTSSTVLQYYIAANTMYEFSPYATHSIDPNYPNAIGRPGWELMNGGTDTGWSNVSSYEPPDAALQSIEDVHDVMYTTTSKIDWRWTCGLYAVWQEKQYEEFVGTGSILADFENDYPDDIQAYPQLQFVIDINEEGTVQYDDYYAKVIDLDSYKEPTEEEYEGYPMTRQGYADYMYSVMLVNYSPDADPPDIEWDYYDECILVDTNSGHLPNPNNSDIFGIMVYGRYETTPETEIVEGQEEQLEEPAEPETVYAYDEVGHFVYSQYTSASRLDTLIYHITVEGSQPEPEEEEEENVTDI